MPRPLPIERVVFPEKFRTGYKRVDDFIAQALTTCVNGDYESFRLLWNARQEPLRREEFEHGWQAVKTIRVRAIEKIVLPQGDGQEAERAEEFNQHGIAPDVSFVLLVEAAFDPDHFVARRGANREFALLLLREEGQWRLGRAPPYVRDWVKERAVGDTNVADAVETHAPMPSP